MKTIAVTTVTVGTATGTLTSNNTNVSANDTVTIGTKVYTFKSSLTPTEGEVLIGGSADASLLNLIRAINHTGTPDTDYKCAAANADVSAASSVTSHAFAVTALVAGIDGAVATTKATATTAVLSWGAATLTGGDGLTIVGTVTEATPSAAAQQVTVAEYPATNRAFIRQQRLTNSQLQCRRSSVGVALTLSEWSKVAMALEPTLSYAPKVLTQPIAASCVHSSTAATFTVADNSSELTIASYLWEYSANGSTSWTAASGTVNGCAYTNGTTATLTCTPTTTAQTGYYHRCTITNAAGSTVSSSAVLTIT